MWVFRCKLNIPWTDHIRKEKVLRHLDKDRELSEIIKKRRTSCFGHVLKHDRCDFLNLINEGKIGGKEE